MLNSRNRSRQVTSGLLDDGHFSVSWQSGPTYRGHTRPRTHWVSWSTPRRPSFPGVWPPANRAVSRPPDKPVVASRYPTIGNDRGRHTWEKEFVFDIVRTLFQCDLNRVMKPRDYANLPHRLIMHIKSDMNFRTNRTNLFVYIYIYAFLNKAA